VKRRFQQAALFIGSLVFFLAIADLALRFALPEGYFVWPPNFHATFSLGVNTLEGADEESSITINPQGMRGDPMSTTARVRLLAVGGSTTICNYLDDHDAWPYLVQQRLSDRLGEGSVWVGNVGRPGHGTHQHRLHVEKLLAQYPQIDAVLNLVGINDMLIRVMLLQDPIPLPPAGSDQDLRQAFSVFPGWDAQSPWYRRTGIARFLVSRRWRLLGERDDGPLVDSRAELILRAREFRRQATSFLDELPGLPEGLASYESNLNAIVDAARAARRRLIFLTQPTLWRDGLSPEEEASLWMGGPRFERLAPGAKFHSVRALAEGMARYNEVLLRVCHTRGVECIDLAGQLPREGAFFWDDAHYTVEGSRRVAQIVSDQLLSREPLASSGSGL
jgi:lysophospholipase L1-like esterase